MRFFILLGIFLASCFPYQDNRWQIPPISEVNIDGSDREWGAVEEYYYRFDNSTNINTQGNFKSGDLQVSLKAAWNERGLYFFVEWEDDVIDSKVIGIDSAAVQNNGRTMDRMYFYDNLKIQLWPDDLNASFWFAPRTDALQWHSLRKEGERNLNAEAISPPNYRLIQQGKKNIIEIEVLWEVLDLKPDSIDKFKIMVLFSDSDVPTTALDQKLKAMELKYVSLLKSVELGNH